VDSVVVSRADRLGDLILSLPALGLLRDAGLKRRILHCSAYARAIGEWAQHNDLATEVWTAGEPLPEVPAGAGGLSLFHAPEGVQLFRSLGLKRTLGPRSKLSALWSYRRSRAQHRSRVEMTEMEYNLDLARAFLEWQGLPVPEFRGLPALALPPEWKSPVEAADLVLVVSNRGSAANWPLEKYKEWGLRERAAGRRVDFLASGLDAKERLAGLKDAEQAGCRVLADFRSIRELIAYLATAKELVSSSTGPLHIAHAAGVPVTGIYPTKRVESFDRWRPHGYWHAAALRYIEIETAQ
jgi:ADP-heptose:LPS heptosyltransferase